ncbi:unnamed protein product, partial [Musa textilis]
LAAYNLDSSPDHPAVETDATRKATSIDLSDDEDNEAGNHMPAIDEDDDDEDFGVVEAPK